MLGGETAEGGPDGCWEVCTTNQLRSENREERKEGTGNGTGTGSSLRGFPTDSAAAHLAFLVSF